jgi:hypothetical protein
MPLNSYFGDHRGEKNCEPVHIDPVESGVDLFWPRPVIPNSAAGCQLYVGFNSSKDGGRTLSKPTQVCGPMSIAMELSATAFGQFVANDITAIYIDAHGDLRVSLRP